MEIHPLLLGHLGSKSFSKTCAFSCEVRHNSKYIQAVWQGKVVIGTFIGVN